MEQLKHMKEALICEAQRQMADLKSVDAKELGEVIDMIKDLEEACYYASIAKAMTEKEHEEVHNHYHLDERGMDKDYGRMYYSGREYREPWVRYPHEPGRGKRDWDYEEREMPIDFRDPKEGRSPSTRKMYMESKELHQDKAKKMKELEKYMQELTIDIAEMIEDSSPEEKQLLHKKISALASKIETL